MNPRQTAAVSLLALWIGASLFFAAVVTPALFAVSAPEDAARAVGRMLPRLDILTITLTGLAAALLVRKSWPMRLLLVGIILAAALSEFWVTPAVAAMREQAGAPISSLSKEDPLRKRFGMLHGLSSSLLVLRILLGVATLVLAGRRQPASDADAAQLR